MRKLRRDRKEEKREEDEEKGEEEEEKELEGPGGEGGGEENRKEVKGSEDGKEKKKKSSFLLGQTACHLLKPGADFLLFTHKSLFPSPIIFLGGIPRSKLLNEGMNMLSFFRHIIDFPCHNSFGLVSGNLSVTGFRHSTGHSVCLVHICVCKVWAV